MAKLEEKLLRNSFDSHLLAAAWILTELVRVGFFCINLLGVSFLWESMLFSFPFPF